MAAQRPALPVLFSSGQGDKSLVQPYIIHEHVGFLRKPYQLAALMEAFDKITRTPIERHAAGEESR